MPPRVAMQEAGAEAAPFLFSVDPMASHLQLRTVSDDEHTVPSSPSATMIEVTYPLKDDEALRIAVSDLGSWSTFRLSEFYEAVDALTADVAYRHTDGVAKGLALVTAGHYHSRKMKRTDISADVVLRCYMTAAGSASLELRTDAIQRDQSGNEALVNVCHTTMVALNGATMRPARGAVPPLAVDAFDAAGQETRAELAALHGTIRKRNSATTMQLRAPMSAPPTAQEMRAIHELHRNAIKLQEAPSPREPTPHAIGDLTFRSSFVVFPENRNVHGKLFGGFVMAQAYNLALYTTSVFARGTAVVPLGIDEAVFLQPISIGDLVTFTARLVHATEQTCRVFVTVEVRAAADPARLPLRSNRLIFPFAARAPPGGVVPHTYGEMLMHLDAVRRHATEGPSEETALALLASARAAL